MLYLLAGLVTAKILTDGDSKIWAQWKEFQSLPEFEGYATQIEHDMRYEIFSSNMQKAEIHNSENHGFTLGITRFADWTEKEFLDYVGSTEMKHVAGETFDASIYRGNADSIDWVAKGAVTAVKNQGQCGSCWAFSTTGSLEGQNQIKNKSLVSFSEQELVDCSRLEGNLGCNGGLMDYGFEYVEKKGICKEADYPYKAEDGRCKRTCTPALTKISGYVDVKSEDDLETAVSNVGPVSVAVDANTKWQLYTKGIISSELCNPKKLDHGVLAVGYNNTEMSWKVKNSWGESWGEKGYVRLEKGRDTCGIAQQPSYPTL
jgi:cathepsin L